MHRISSSTSFSYVVILVDAVQGGSARFLYGWIPGDQSWLFNYNLSVRGRKYVRLEDGNLESMEISPGFEFNTKNGIRVDLSMEIAKEGVLDDFNLSDSIVIQAGEYAFSGFEARFGTSEAKRISFRGETYLGQFYNGKRMGFESELNLNFSSNFTLSPGYDFNHITFPERVSNNTLNIHSINMRAQIMLSTKFSANILVQYVNTEDEFIGNFRLRYNPREGNDFYLVYNDLRGFFDRNLIPGNPPFHSKTIMLKYTHTFIL